MKTKQSFALLIILFFSAIIAPYPLLYAESTGQSPTAISAAKSFPLFIKGTTIWLNVNTNRQELLNQLKKLFDSKHLTENEDSIQCDTTVETEPYNEFWYELYFGFDKNGKLNSAGINAQVFSGPSPEVDQLLWWLKQNAGNQIKLKYGVKVWRYAGWEFWHHIDTPAHGGIFSTVQIERIRK